MVFGLVYVQLPFMVLPLYAALVVLHREPIIRPQYNLIYAAAMAVIGFVVGFQAYRLRVLTRYFDERKADASESPT